MEGEENSSWPWAFALSLAISLLLHLLAGWTLAQLPPPERKPARPAAQLRCRTVKVSRAEKPPREQPKEKAFAKTDPDLPQQRPDAPDFEGKRSARASSAPNGPKLRSDAPAPTQEGEERDEINTLERNRQDGPLEHDGKQQPAPDATTAPAEPAVPTEQPPVSNDVPQTDEPADQSDTQQEQEAPEERQGAVSPAAGAVDRQDEQSPAAVDRPPEREGVVVATPSPADGQGGAPRLAQRQAQRRPVYDPSLADHAQPGFRTLERRSRSAGRFVLGKHASLNVEASPKGKYQELIYRRIAYFWYIACDDHRGDIIPGSITIALRVNKNGSIANMSLVNRRGASMIQQSFTFGAIRKATLPPMPEKVQEGLVGDLMEMIFTFNFD